MFFVFCAKCRNKSCQDCRKRKVYFTLKSYISRKHKLIRTKEIGGIFKKENERNVLLNYKKGRVTEINAF